MVYHQDFNLHLLTTMCKSMAQIPRQQIGKEEKRADLGIFNISSNTMSWISIETILELITVLILVIVVTRWVQKCLDKEKERKNRKPRDIIRQIAPIRQSSFNSENPRGLISELPSIQIVIIHLLTINIFILHILTTKCNSKTQVTKRQLGNEKKTTSLGLHNISSNTRSWISLETILEQITVLILAFLDQMGANVPS